MSIMKTLKTFFLNLDNDSRIFGDAHGFFTPNTLQIHNYYFDVIEHTALGWWILVGIIALLSVGVFSLYRSRLRIIENQKKKLEALVQERTAEILKQTRKIELQKEQIEKEKIKVENLLLNMLPTEIVEELTNKGKAQAKHFRIASVMFTDFKNFTHIAEVIRPKDLIAELDRLFIRFDEIIGKYGIEKIKTIGDSYMCAGGLPIRNKTNPVDIVLAGLEIQRYIESIKAEKIAKGEEFWELRVGINTGELIAGVIGSKRFAYDIWGDTVNVASRMEQKGVAGKVNISGPTYNYIKNFFECTYRGKIEAKNKGEVDMYFVDRILPELSIEGNGIEPNALFYEKLKETLVFQSNYKKAEQFILKKLTDELPKNLSYHALQHTIEVTNAAERIGKEEGVSGENLNILKTAALLHDSGFIYQYAKNEPLAVDVAKEILPNFGYTHGQIKTIEKMILATQIPQKPETLLEKILCDADLDYLGRPDFYPVAEMLKKELFERGLVKDDKSWDELQISFLSTHQYFTKTSQKLRDPEKQKRLQELKKRLADLV
jgi:class 3 adenylate cyclase